MWSALRVPLVYALRLKRKQQTKSCFCLYGILLALWMKYGLIPRATDKMSHFEAHEKIFACALFLAKDPFWRHLRTKSYCVVQHLTPTSLFFLLLWHPDNNITCSNILEEVTRWYVKSIRRMHGSWYLSYSCVVW